MRVPLASRNFSFKRVKRVPRLTKNSLIAPLTFIYACLGVKTYLGKICASAYSYLFLFPKGERKRRKEKERTLKLVRYIVVRFK